MFTHGPLWIECGSSNGHVILLILLLPLLHTNYIGSHQTSPH